MHAAVAVDVRSQIFSLRQQGATHRAIAEQLGISAAKVQRELRKPAPVVRAERQAELEPPEGAVGAFHAGVEGGPVAPSADPMVLEARRQVEIERAELQRMELQARRLEAQRRLALMQNPNDQGAMLQLQTLEALKTISSALAVRQQPATPPAPQPTLVDQLAQYRQVAETMQSFQPPKPPSSASELEFTVAMEKVKLEERRINTQLEMEHREREERLSSERARNDAFARFLEQLGPMLPVIIDRWRPAVPGAGDQVQEPPPQSIQPTNNNGADNVVQMPPQRAAANGSGARLAGEVVGECPHCQTRVGITGANSERCPECGYLLAVVEGQIRVNLGGGSYFPPVAGAEF